MDTLEIESVAQSNIAGVNGETRDSVVVPKHNSALRVLSPKGQGEVATPQGQDRRKIAIPYRRREQMLYTDTFITLQKFEGRVLSVGSQRFTVRLTNLSEPSAQEEEAELFIEEVWDDDKPLLRPGAEFYWSIGYERKAFGQRTRASIIRFKRLPIRTKESLQRTLEKARYFRSFLDLTCANSSAE